MAVIVVGVLEGLGQPKWLGIRDLAQGTGFAREDGLLGASESTNDQSLELRFLEDLVSMKAEESLCGVLAG